jgi:dolichol-phosphate mannosyltransferase
MKLLIVLPTYNEKPNIERVLERILRHDFAHVLVVDDASPDGTAAIAEGVGAASGGRVQVMHRKGPRGLGLAYIDGLRRALTTDADAIGQMDADLSHDPIYLPDMVAKLEQYEMVIGSRYMRGVSVVNWPLHRIALSAFANRYIRLITGLKTTDCTGSYRVWRRDALARMPLDHARANGYAFLTEMLYEAVRRGIQVGESPIVFVERLEGYSKVSGAVLTESLLTPWRLILRGGRLRG